MKKIVKTQEPKSLTQHRKFDKTDYRGYSQKQELRESLVGEQRGICCYCMGRIYPNESTMKIEHFLSHSGHPNLRLVYSNLFGACLGNMKAKAEEHCDTFKKSKEFHFHMCSSGSIHNEIKYKTNGEIYSDNEELYNEIGKPNYFNDEGILVKEPGILNLNLPELIKARKSTLDGFIKANLSGKLGPLNKIRLKRFRDKWAGDSHADQLQPYCMIVVYYLDKKIAAYK
ncbi:retron system putative HNH endonuclease [Elizabethkingia miricola]|uniref:retron system putative HNH endonuclease n=1 Tax=Elizabethkingia miricola TaxID=172045 RepID=UPI0038919FDE